METVRTARLHERNDFKMLQKQLAWCCWNAKKYVTFT